MIHVLLILGALSADTAVAGAERDVVLPDSVLDFQLPLPGETVSQQGTGILVQGGPSVRTVRFSWTGPGAEGGSEVGSSQGFGYWAAGTGPVPAGDWTVEAKAFDSAGQELAHAAVRFRSAGQARPDRGSPDAGVPARVQSLHLGVSGGWRDGASEDPLRSSTDLLAREGGRAERGDRWEPFDRRFLASGFFQYDYRERDLRIRARGSSDLSESWGHAGSPSRAGVDLWYGPWAEIHLGDQYPQWTPSLMDGSRVRGLGIGGAATWDGRPVARMDLAWGEMRPELAAQERRFGDGSTDTLPVQFRRTFQAVHLGAGMGSPLSMHLVALHAKDECSAVQGTFQDSLGGPTPRENLALGGDASWKPWDGILELYAASGLSLVTDDARSSSALDSLRSDDPSRLPTFLSDVFTFNLSTRGSERFLSGNGDFGRFAEDNLSFRGGTRLAIPLPGGGRSRMDLRWIHVGPQFESFARSSRETSRTGLEWTASAALSGDRLLVVGSGSAVDEHPSTGTDVPTRSATIVCSWTGGNGGPGLHASSGALSSGGGAQQRIEGWNTGVGASGTARILPGTLSWNADWTTASSRSRSVVSDTVVATARVLQNDLDLSGRWRPVPDLEWRLGYQLGDSKIPLDSLPEHREQDHRLQCGASRWLVGRKLELAVDGGVSVRAGDASTDVSGWSQSARLKWEPAQGQAIRFSQVATRTGARHDFRLDAGWEGWF